MTRIFWDSMLFVSLFQKEPKYWERVAYLRKRSIERGDEMCTSHLALGEIMAGAYRDKDETTARAIRAGWCGQTSGFCRSTSNRWNRSRAFGREHKTAAADSLHLACAASYGGDVFITGDKG
jgi:uncharacterized protein